ncbi:HXXXD-type acyl-transferase family protein [Rhynchospora pubera]|uniref:HXXXD-type acyl-transferase family protein n=1 Tax=Rhynchospora pubera TaxID=906938 RepID=A0AAV8FZH4_9POAL|nr:HXXXD-type acyl-transferase family protein [Rhynchospora pubera]
MSRVRVLEVSRVAVQPSPYPVPDKTIELSFFDSMYVRLPHLQLLFLFPDTATDSFPGIIGSFKSSLTRMLPFFHPFAGKLTYIPSAARAVIDCSASAISEGITFIEAESDLDIRSIAKYGVQDHDTFVQLLPNVTVPELPTVAFAVQVTRFLSGGVALGIAVHHTVADGKGIWQFIEAWASICRTGSVPSAGFIPVHDRAVIKYSGGDEIAKDFIRKVAPNLPKTAAPHHSLQERMQLTKGTFLVDGATIKSWKKEGIHVSPSTFISISARVLVTVASVRGLTNDNGPFFAGFPVDCRSRLNPPINDSYTGNCIAPCFARMTASEVAGPGGFIRACAALKEAVIKANKEPLVGCEGWIDEALKVPAGRAVRFTGSPGFKFYEADFGWGKPDQFKVATLNRDGDVVLVSGKDEGTVEVSVVLPAQHMDAFAKRFLSPFSRI